MQWIECMTVLGSLKAESELLNHHHHAVLLQEWWLVSVLTWCKSKKFFCKAPVINVRELSVLLINSPPHHQSLDVLLVTVSIRYFVTQNMGLKTESGAVHFYLIGLHEERFQIKIVEQDCYPPMQTMTMLSYVPTLPLILYAFYPNCSHLASFLKCPLTLSHKNV